MSQFVRLMVLLKIPSGNASDIADSVVDWIDSDNIAAARGAEDQYYLQLETPYRTANAVMVDVSELRAIKGVNPEVYGILAPWLCALPTTELSPININSLRPKQAVLLAMLSTANIDLRSTRQFLGRRPNGGYANSSEFWRQAFPASFNASGEVQSQTKVRTRWFRLDLTVEMANALVEERALVDAGKRPARLVHRERGDVL